MPTELPDLAAIKARLLRAGYPPPSPDRSEHVVRATTREAQAARAELREHIIDDLWALIAALEASETARGSSGADRSPSP